MHDVVMWGKVDDEGKGPPPRVTVDGVPIPAVTRVEVRDVTRDEERDLPVRPLSRPDARYVQVRQAYEVVLTFVEDQGSLWSYAVEDGPRLLHPLRPTASVRDQNGRPQPRDQYAAHLEQRLTASSEGEVEVTAALLDELAALYPDEPLGWLAERLAGRIHDRGGV